MRTRMPEFDNRALGAIAIAFAGVLLGFATGRLSAWVVPPAGMLVATSSGSTSKPAIPLEPARTAKSTPSRPESTPPGATGTAEAKPSPPPGVEAGETQSARADAKPPAEAADNSKPASSNVTSRALSPSETVGPAERQLGTGPADSDAKAINPGHMQKQERPAQARISEETGGDTRVLTTSPDGLERCRRQYRSFDPSDGTYKPYGQDVRVPCPYLR